MIKNRENAQVRNGENITLYNLVSREDQLPLSIALAELSGEHHKTRNIESTRYYIIIEGTAKVDVGGEVCEVKEGDVVVIEKGVWHSIVGDVKYYVVNTPPFNFQAEEKP